MTDPWHWAHRVKPGDRLMIDPKWKTGPRAPFCGLLKEPVEILAVTGGPGEAVFFDVATKDGEKSRHGWSWDWFLPPSDAPGSPQAGDPPPAHSQASPEGEARSCDFCGLPLLTKLPNQRFCSGVGSSCRQRAGAFRQAMDRLVAMDEAEFRAELRGVCRRRYGRHVESRFFLRFGVRSAGRRGS